jgi:hypothetical protein
MAQAKVTMGSATHETVVSYLTRDPLGLLAQALIEFIWPEDATVFVFSKGEEHIDAEELRRRVFAWEDEPGGWQWTLQPLGTSVSTPATACRGRSLQVPDLALSMASTSLFRLNRNGASRVTNEDFDLL